VLTDEGNKRVVVLDKEGNRRIQEIGHTDPGKLVENITAAGDFKDWLEPMNVR